MYFGTSLPKMLGKISSCQVFCFWFRSLFLRFPLSSFLCFFLKKHSSGSHSAHSSRTFFVCSFSLLLSPLRLLSPVLAVRHFVLAFCRGAILGLGRFGVFRILSEHRGLEITRPLLRPVLGRKAAWVFIVDSLFVVFVFPLQLCFAAFSHQLEGADPSLNEAYPRVIAPAPHRGAPSCAAVWIRPFGINLSLLCVSQRVTGVKVCVFHTLMMIERMRIADMAQGSKWKRKTADSIL